jgi:hypothetical protein
VRKTSGALALGVAAIGAAAIGAAMGMVLGRPARDARDRREYPLGFFQSGAECFSVIDIKVGNRSQLANSTALPGYLFTKGGTHVKVALDVATVAMDIALVVENITSSNQTFMAALVGTAAQ